MMSFMIRNFNKFSHMIYQVNVHVQIQEIQTIL